MKESGFDSYDMGVATVETTPRYYADMYLRAATMGDADFWFGELFEAEVVREFGSYVEISKSGLDLTDYVAGARDALNDVI